MKQALELVGHRIIANYDSSLLSDCTSVIEYTFPAFSLEDAEELLDVSKEGDILEISATYYLDEAEIQTIRVKTNSSSRNRFIELMELTSKLGVMSPYLQIATNRRPEWN